MPITTAKARTCAEQENSEAAVYLARHGLHLSSGSHRSTLRKSIQVDPICRQDPFRNQMWYQFFLLIIFSTMVVSIVCFYFYLIYRLNLSPLMFGVTNFCFLNIRFGPKLVGWKLFRARRGSLVWTSIPPRRHHGVFSARQK